SWTPIRRGSSSGSTIRIAASPSTNTAVWRRKCAATTGAPAATGCVRSSIETVSARESVIRQPRSVSSPKGEGKLRDAALKTLADFVFGKIAPDKDDAAVALLAFLPRPLMIAVEDHVHALEDEAVVIVLE